MSLADAPQAPQTTTAGWSLIGTSPKSAVVNADGVTFNGRLWGLGASPSSSVVSSPDGLDWQSNASLPWRTSAAACAHNGALWVTGGALEEATSDVFSSPDGLHWTHTVAPWPPRFGHCVVSDGDHITLFGGRTRTGTFYDDVWVSKDGITWTSAGKADISTNGAAAVVGPDLCLINTISGWVHWFSGGKWQPPETAPWPAPRISPGVAVINDVLYLVGGGAGGAPSNDMWSATGPGTWERQPSAPWTGALSGIGCGELNGSVIVFGGADASGTARPEIYRYTPG